MRRQPKGPLVLALLVMTVGVGWLLTVQGYMPGVNWIWVLGLGVVGVLTFVLSGGLDKASVILGPFFLVSSCLSLARQTGRLSANIEPPILVILMGLLLLVAQFRFIPYPKWLEGPPEQ